MTPDQEHEWLCCAESPAYFLHVYALIYDATDRLWIPFVLWPSQVRTLRTVQDHSLTIILKARQLGLSWLLLGYALWLMLFHPAATVLLFSRREDEALYMLGAERLRGMYDRLPAWMKVKEITKDDARAWALSNGSIARAFPANGGDSYSATFAIVDEADLVPNLDRLLTSAKPTIDGGGKLVLLSRADKSRPESPFKQIYRAAKAGDATWAYVFLPWYVRPSRDEIWYERERQNTLATTGTLDALYEQYPATDLEALAPRSLDKRIPAEWLQRVYQEQSALPTLATPNAPNLPGLAIFKPPTLGMTYVIGVDPAEGNPTSDDSALTVVNTATGEEVASMAGKYQPSTLAAAADTIGKYFNQAGIMVERNNHGHAVLLWLRDNSVLHRLTGLDNAEGWLSNSKGKSVMYDAVADAVRDANTIIHSFGLFVQLSAIEGSTLRAPSGQHDDRADSYALALQGRARMAAVGAFTPAVGGTRHWDEFKRRIAR